MANVIEHIFCSECLKEFTPEGQGTKFCSTCSSIWEDVESYSNEELAEIISDVEYHLNDYLSDPYIGPLIKEEQEEYDELCLWLQILQKEDSSREKVFCSECDENVATIEDLCADCYWEEDARRKQERRNNPLWRFCRMMDFQIVVQGMNEKEAYTHACDIFRKEGIPIPV